MTDAVTLLAGKSAKASEEWWKTAVVYQIYPRSFADSNNDGVGDLRGIIEHIDHLVYLGVDVVWLSPIYPSGGADNGYDICDYQSIDPVFGTMDDFDELVAALHNRGIRVLMDLVVNHTSNLHPWFLDSSSGALSSKRDWYYWKSAKDGAEPTNWESFFSGSAWTLDAVSGQYYLHLFSAEQPDLNWENPDVRASVHGVMNWWLDRGVDGFRMDVINLISKNPAFPEGAVAPDARWGNGFAHFSYGPRIHEFLQEMHEAVFAGRIGDFVTVGEMPGVTVEQAAIFTDPERAELNMVFQFEHVGLDHGISGKWEHRPIDPVELKKSFSRWQEGLAESGWNSLYWNNHDQPRVVSRFGDDGQYWRESATALAAILHLQRGTPYIYQGEELGMTNAEITTIADLRDIESLNWYTEVTVDGGESAMGALDNIRRISRDNARTPMQWSNDPNGGFTTGVPWIAANRNHTLINARAQLGVPDSIFEFYRSLIRLRHSEPAISYGAFQMLEREHPSLFAFERTHGSDAILLIANYGKTPIKLPDLDRRWSESEVLLSNYPALEGGPPSDLRPWEIQVRKVVTTP